MAFVVVPSVPVSGGRLAITDGKGLGLGSGGSDRNPLAAAWYWLSQGAGRIHFEATGEINLEPAIPALVLACRSSGAVIQVGGGVRNAHVARTLRGIGADHLVVRSMANSPDTLSDLIGAIGPEHVMPAWTVPVAAEDARHFWGMVAESWELGVRRCTLSSADDVSVTSMIPVLRSMVRHGWEVWVAGRVRTHTQLSWFEDAGAAGAILGTALYRGDVDWSIVKEARRLAQ